MPAELCPGENLGTAKSRRIVYFCELKIHTISFSNSREHEHR